MRLDWTVSQLRHRLLECWTAIYRLFFGVPMRMTRSRWKSSCLWALVLLTFWGGLPQMSCVCADGQRKLWCTRILMQMVCGPESAGECCCTKDSSGLQTCATERPRCPHCRPSKSPAGPVANENTCCHPEWKAAQFVGIEKAPRAQSDGPGLDWCLVLDQAIEPATCIRDAALLAMSPPSQCGRDICLSCCALLI